MTEDRVEQNQMRHSFGVGQGECHGVGPRGVMTDQHAVDDAQLVEDGRQFGSMVLRGETGDIRAIRPAVAEPIEGHGPPRREHRQELVVDPVIVGKAMHQDDRGLLPRILEHVEGSPFMGHRVLDDASVDCGHCCPLSRFVEGAMTSSSSVVAYRFMACSRPHVPGRSRPAVAGQQAPGPPPPHSGGVGPAGTQLRQQPRRG